ncbi:hypothetical protein [Kocuria rosea]|uniref:hypothetical protein n=1 Tax=Kocuria rosea TaxID=1275 RepID=UPI0011A7DE6B|nr:hypothetical protein [Kocuria rosea]
MRRMTPALLVLAAVVLTGCGPTTEEVASMVAAGSAKTYDDALALREDILAAGLPCPGTDQLLVPDENGTAYLECDYDIPGMVVTNTEEDLQHFLELRQGADLLPVLHGRNWMIIARTEAPLQQLQDELSGTILPAP